MQDPPRRTLGRLRRCVQQQRSDKHDGATRCLNDALAALCTVVPPGRNRAGRMLVRAIGPYGAQKISSDFCVESRLGLHFTGGGVDHRILDGAL
jgi:hypothetical protein